MPRLVLAALALATLSLPLAAQELPAVCLENAPHAEMDHGGAMGSKDQGSASEAHSDLMAGMDAMNADMMAGGTATDIDVAFVCSMIPHHLGAISMAEAELKHGDDPFARELAEAIIAAQREEIAAMLNWLTEQGQ